MLNSILTFSYTPIVLLVCTFAIHFFLNLSIYVYLSIYFLSCSIFSGLCLLLMLFLIP
jgi:hypothetical protein